MQRDTPPRPHNQNSWYSDKHQQPDQDIIARNYHPLYLVVLIITPRTLLIITGEEVPVATPVEVSSDIQQPLVIWLSVY